MRRFYLEYENQQALSVKLSWSHYCGILNVSAKQGRSFYQQESINSNWSVLELKRQTETSLFERLLLSNGSGNKEKFLLELGFEFMFVGSQQRITLGNTHYYVDMVFYNKVLKAYALIDLKMGSLKPENIGQMNMYVNYYANEVNDDGDDKPIGIILCADTSEIVAEYALGGLENQNFASKYVCYIPNKEELIQQVQSVMNDIGESL